MECALARAVERAVDDGARGCLTDRAPLSVLLDVPAEQVTRSFLKWLRNDAITFEIWGRFYTGASESVPRALSDNAKPAQDNRKLTWSADTADNEKASAGECCCLY